MNALRPVILAIEADFFVLPRRQPEHLQREKLQRSQQLAPAVEQQGGIRSGEINQNFRLLPIAVFRNRGSTTMRYLNRSPPCVTTACRNSLIFLAAATL